MRDSASIRRPINRNIKKPIKRPLGDVVVVSGDISVQWEDATTIDWEDSTTIDWES